MDNKVNTTLNIELKVELLLHITVRNIKIVVDETLNTVCIIIILSKWSHRQDSNLRGHTPPDYKSGAIDQLSNGG